MNTPARDHPTAPSSDAVAVAVQFDDDNEAGWLYRPDGRDPDHADGWLARIPTTRWERFLAAHDTIRSVTAEAVAASGRDDQGRLPQPCQTWRSYQDEPRTTWRIVCTPDDKAVGDTWPAQEATISPWFDNPDDATALLDAVTQQRWLLVVDVVISRLTEIDPTRLSIRRHYHPGYTGSCEQCGWDRPAHTQRPLQ